MSGTPGWMSQSIVVSGMTWFNPARLRVRRQSDATPSSATLGVFCPNSTAEIAPRSCRAMLGQIGSRGSSFAVFIVAASTGAQPKRSATVGSLKTDTRGGGFGQFGVVDQRSIWRQSERHRVTIVLAAGDDFIELPGDGIRDHDFVFRHQVAVIFQRLHGFVVVDQDLPDFGIEILAAVAARERGKATKDGGSLPAPDAKTVPFRWLRGGFAGGQEFVPVLRRLGDPGRREQRLLI